MPEQPTRDLLDSYQATFADVWLTKLSQQHSVFEGYVSTDQFDGDRKKIEFVGDEEVNELKGRNQPTIPSKRAFWDRWMIHRQFESVDEIAETDKVALGKLPTLESIYSTSQARGYKKNYDRLVVEAMTSQVVHGKNGTKLLDFDTSTNVIAVNHGGTNAGLTLKKLSAASTKMDKAFVNEERYIAIGTQQNADMILNIEEAKSSDYFNGEILKDGSIKGKKFLGFTFLQYELLNHNVSDDIRECPVWHKDALVFATNPSLNPGVSIDRVFTRSNMIQIRTTYYQSCTRKRDSVYIIKCDESI